MLIVMSGRAGTGKSTIARAVAARLPAAAVSVDPVEDALRRAGVAPDQPTGLAAYMAAEAVAEEVLAAGLAVVIDAVNAVEPARRQWRQLAARAGVRRVVVEVHCSDPALHRSRLETRSRGLPALPEPTWDAVRAREYEPWTEPVLRLDSVHPVERNVAMVLAAAATGP